jgi:hypothetical protein
VEGRFAIKAISEPDAAEKSRKQLIQVNSNSLYYKPHYEPNAVALVKTRAAFNNTPIVLINSF